VELLKGKERKKGRNDVKQAPTRSGEGKKSQYESSQKKKKKNASCVKSINRRGEKKREGAHEKGLNAQASDVLLFRRPWSSENRGTTRNPLKMVVQKKKKKKPRTDAAIRMNRLCIGGTGGKKVYHSDKLLDLKK